jgi:hypothetical protein
MPQDKKTPAAKKVPTEKKAPAAPAAKPAPAVTEKPVRRAGKPSNSFLVQNPPSKKFPSR